MNSNLQQSLYVDVTLECPNAGTLSKVDELLRVSRVYFKSIFSLVLEHLP